MKKSNKQILIAFLLPLVFIGVVHLSLYAKYRSGEFVTRQQQHDEQFARKEFSAPMYLSIKGVRKVTVIASDTFAVEFPKGYVSDGKKVYRKEFGPDGVEATVQMDEPVLHYFQQGDTLTVVGYDSAALKNNSLKNEDSHSFPDITIYCRGIRTMAFERVQVGIQQQQRPALTSDSRIVLQKSECTFNNDDADGPDPLYLYGTIRMEMANSKLDLNVSTSIGTLQLNLDSLSTFDDQSAKIENLDMHWSDRSQIHLSGANMRKLQTVKP